MGKLFKGKKGKKGATQTNGGLTRPSANRKTASFIWFYYGDNKVSTFGQETLKLKKAMDGYDRKVLMKLNETPSWLDLSEADERRADIIMPPTPGNFTDQLVSLARENYIIDIYIFAHGWSSGFTGCNGTHGEDRSITSERIRNLPAAAGLPRLPIRAVYQTQCYAADLNDDWRAAGAKVSAGSRYIQYYPNQFKNFIKDWNKGDRSFSDSLAGDDTATIRTMAQAYILADAAATRSEWGGCPLTRTVLGNHDCAKAYHTTAWLEPDEWRDDMSGKQNMNYSSSMRVRGDRALTKDSQPSWAGLS